MAEQYVAGQKLDLLTAGELGNELHKHMGDKFLTRMQEERLRGFKLMKLPLISMQAPGANFTLSNVGSGVPCGPESGYIWLVPRLIVSSSDGYQEPGQGATLTSALGAGVGTPGAGTLLANIGAVMGGTYLVQWTTMISGATANVANNFEVVVNGVNLNHSVNTTAIGNTVQNTLIVVVPPTVNGITVGIKNILADAAVGVVYNATVSITPQFVGVGGGDSAIVSGLYVGSDPSNPTQAQFIDGLGITLGKSYYTGTKGIYVKAGEQIFATITGATAGVTYTLAGHAIEVPTVMQGKLLD